MQDAVSSQIGGFRHWMKIVLISAVTAALAGFAISYLFSARYTSHSLIMVEGPNIPETIVAPVVSSDLSERIATLQQQTLSQSRLQPMLERSGLAKPGQNTDDLIDAIRDNMSVQPVVTDPTEVGVGNKNPTQNRATPGFYINYTASNAHDAQQLCNELTSLLLEENLKSREDAAKQTFDFLRAQVEEAKQSLDNLDQKVGTSKNQHAAPSLGIDYDNARRIYQDDLAKLSAAKMAQQVEQQQLGERMHLLNPADLPAFPDFPNRILFALGGLVAGLVFGIGLLLWRSYRLHTTA